EGIPSHGREHADEHRGSLRGRRRAGAAHPSGDDRRWGRNDRGHRRREVSQGAARRGAGAGHSGHRRLHRVSVEWVTVGPFQENSYLVRDPSGAAILIDPGDEAARIVRMVRAADAKIEAIWLTHAHLDHIGAIAAIKREW